MNAQAAAAGAPALAFVLDGPADWDGFRRLARHAVGEGLWPDDVHWRVDDAAAPGLFDDRGRPFRPADLVVEPPAVALPPDFVAAARLTLMHDDPGRFDLLYRWVHRLVHAPAAWDDPLSAERVRLARRAQAVRREMHKMKAFVRFNRTGKGPDGDPLVAWFEPAHFVVDAVAPFFARRLGSLRWAILTPRGSVRFDGTALHRAAPADAAQRPGSDDGQPLWIAYYQSIFNPARLNLAAMQRDMPKRLWRNLPETVWVQPLSQAAPLRTAAMLEAPTTVRRRRRGSASAVGDRPPRRA